MAKGRCGDCGEPAPDGDYDLAMHDCEEGTWFTGKKDRMIHALEDPNLSDNARKVARALIESSLEAGDQN